MDPPAIVQVGPYPYRVNVTEAAMNWARNAVHDTHIVGAHHGDIGEIFVDPAAGAMHQRDTLLHEILHAIFYVTGGLPKEHDEEYAVGALSSILLDTLRRNPHLVRYLMDGAMTADRGEAISAAYWSESGPG